jgi:hypothetical protein
MEHKKFIDTFAMHQLADDAAMAEAYVVGIVVTQE